MTTTTQQADLSALRINRDKPGPPTFPSIPWKIVVPVLVAAVLAAVYFFVIRGSGREREVDLTTATMTSPSASNAVLTASGYVVAQVKAAVASKGTGRLVYLGVEEGDRVKKGEIIARLEDQDMRAALRKAEADLGIARADDEESKLTLERQKSLFERNLTSRAELDAATARFKRVEATIRAAEAGVAAAGVQLENTQIRAPFDGTVLTKNADVGEVVAPFTSSASSRAAVVTMADMQSLQVEADVSESNIIRVHPGQPCEIVLDAYPEKRYPGVVHKIVPTADRAKATVLTKVAFRSMDERVLPEMSAKVMFLSKEEEGSKAGSSPVLTIPLSAVATRQDRKVVLLVRNGTVSEMPVTLGEVLGDRIAVREGLTAGDQVVLRADPSITTGTRIKPVGQ
jgi:RND family efflux transporter MFP subunit